MVFRVISSILFFSYFSFPQLAIDSIDPSKLTPQQHAMATQIIKSSLPDDSVQPELSQGVELPQNHPTNNTLIEIIETRLELSSIEEMYSEVDVHHGVKISEDQVETTRAPLRQFGYELFYPKIRESYFFRYNNASSNIPVPKTYQLQSGDFFTLFIYGKKEQVMELTIDTDGNVFVPNIGPILVSGLTLEDANLKIYKSLERRYVNFETRLKLNSVKRVMVILSGHVRRPGAYNVGKFESIFSVLTQGGGVENTGSLRHIKLIRSNGEKESIDLYDYLLVDSAAPTLHFNEGDVIFIPAIGPTVAIDGAVNEPGIFEIKKNTTLFDVVSFGGGPAVNAYMGSVYINGFDATFKRQVKTVEGSNLLNKLKKIRAQNGDVLILNPKPKETIGYVNVLGNVNVPGRFEYTEALTLGQLMAKSEGLKPDAHDTVHVFRYISDHERELVTTSIKNINFKLNDRDVVTIYNVTELKEPQLISVMGEVQRSGNFTFFKKMTLSDALILAKPTVMASLVSVEVARVAGKKAELFYIKYSDLAQFELQPGDQISVKKDNLKDQMATIELGGEVVFPGQYRVAKGTRLAEVIRRAGGYTDSAYLKGAVFTRASVSRDDETGQKKVIDDEQKRFIYDQTHLGNLSMDSQVSMGIMMTARQEALQYLEQKVGATSGRVIIDLDQSNFQESSDNFTIQEGDKLVVPTIPESVHVIGGVQQAISIAYNPRYSVHHYIKNVGGFTKYADRGNIYIFKASGRVFQNNAAIEPGDIVYVPEKVIISFNWLQFLTNITSIISNAVTSIALVKSLQ